MTSLAFVDVETTGLDPERHEIWEVGLIVRAAGRSQDENHRWLLPVERLEDADAFALEVGGFHTRHPQGSASDVRADELARREDVAGAIARLTHGAHLVGAVVSFDEQRLRRLLRIAGFLPSWHYHLVDVEALAAGQLRVEPPWSSDELSLAVGIDRRTYRSHEALEDARWARDVYDSLMCPAWRSAPAPAGTRGR